MKEDKEKTKILDLNTKITELQSQIDKQKYIIEQNKEFLFILENQNENNQIKCKKTINEINEKRFIFTIIIPIYNTEKYLSEAIESVINQTFTFDNIEIILIDDGSTDNSKEICEEYVNKYPNNIICIHNKNQGASIARNTGLKIAKGKFINFLDSDDKLEPNTLNEIYYHFNKFGEKIDVISIPRWKFDRIEGPMPLFNKYEPSRIVDIYEEYDFSIVSVNSAFLRKSSAVKYKFNSNLIISEDSHFINKLILDKCKFGVVNSVKYLYRRRVEENSIINTKKTNKEYFNQRMKDYFKDLIYYSYEKYGDVIKYVQSLLMYDLKWFFLQNTEKNVLNEEELKEFYVHLHDILQVVDDEIINSQNVSKFIKKFMLDIKYNYPNLIINNDLICFENGVSLDKLSENRIIIEKISAHNNPIITCNFKFYSKNININAKYNEKNLKIINKHIEEIISISHVIAYEFNFEVELETSETLEHITFEMEYESNKYQLLSKNRIND